MDKLKFETPDMVSENVDKIAALFPSAITEMRGEDGEIKRGVNFEVLKQLLSRDVVDGDECYEFTWVGKKAAMTEAARPITKTLRPVKADSRDWDTTENLYIEGDNLEVLKILQESYLGKVKMIYIDPPYNTGSDRFIYPDDYSITKEEYDELNNSIAGGCVCYDKVAFVLLTVGCFCFGVFLLFQPVPDRAGLGIGKHLPLQLLFPVQRLFHLLQLCKAFPHGGIGGRTGFVQFLRGRKAVLLIGGNGSRHLL